MTLAELSEQYSASALLLKQRLRQLRAEAAAASAEERQNLAHRIYVLSKIQNQMYELARLTAHYYERGYYRDRKYTL